MTTFARNAVFDRSARQVRCLRLRTWDSGDRLRVQTMLEEALRLTTLPGEDQGRLYYFRRLRLPALPASGASGEWIARCAEHLLAIGRSASPAVAAGAESADAVFFASAAEPFTAVLLRLLSGREAREWFWAAATAVPPDLPPSQRIAQLLEMWRFQPAGWSAVARELLAVVPCERMLRLIEQIPVAHAAAWLDELAPESGQRTPLPVPVFRPDVREIVYRLRMRLNSHDPRLVWFCMLALLDAAPALAQDGGLRAMAQIAASPFRAPEAEPRRQEDTRAGAPLKAPRATVVEEPSRPGEAQEPAISGAGESSDDQAGADVGLDTAFAGLYFLLTPLRCEGIAQAIEEHPELAASRFVERVLLRLAERARVPPRDPVLQPLLKATECVACEKDPVVLPRSFASIRRLRPSGDLSERLWAAAVRRWCHVHAKLPLAAVVARPGRFYPTATSLDVLLPMSTVDIRIRRCGLDLDPGYLPWLGQAVHFTYLNEVVRGQTQ